MGDFFSSPAANILVLMFIWVPFALGAYLDEHWNRERARKLLHPMRHIGRARPAVPTAA